jgi:xanthine/uracil permease|tara:strand:+ start:1061 stop:1351 length:291 start_codon:yes stop_codon:yes gene_type:complete
MATEVSENSKFTLSLKSIGILLTMVASFIGMYYSLSMEIQEAKELPKVEIPDPEITRQELDLKLELISTTVMSNAEKLGKIETQVEKIEERVYELK